jgi:diacylglycerol kinase (ATP)
MYILIVNPTAGHGRAKKIYETLKNHPLYREKDCRAFFTEYAGHATEMVQQIVLLYREKINAVLVVGGDGTLYEVINGLKNFPDQKLAFIPAGSGNDFARGCNLEEKGEKLFEQILIDPSFQPFWFGQFSRKEKDRKTDLLFGNCLGFGFDAVVAKRANEASYKKVLNKIKLGSISYIIALIQTLFSFKPIPLELIIDGKKRNFSKTFLVTLTNHPYFGGGMKIAPHAKINEDYVYGIVVHNISKWKVLFLFLTVFFGKHTKFKEVYTFKGKYIEIKSKQKMIYQIDGQTGSCKEGFIQKDKHTRFVHRF